MYQLSAPVGSGKLNQGGDVAFLQFAFKVIRGRNGQPLYTGPIDGSYDDATLGDAMQAFYDLYRRPNSLRRGYISQSDFVLGKIPVAYRNYHIRPYRRGVKWGLALVSKSGSLAPGDHRKYALPTAEAKAFARIETRLGSRFGVVTEIEKQIVDQKGRFLVNLAIKGGKRIDPNTAAIIEKQGRPTKDYVTFLLESYGAELMQAESLWNMYHDRSLVLRSRRTYPELIIDAASKRRVLRQLGYKPVKKDGAARSIEHCMAVYERALILDQVSPELERLIFDCFGTDRDAVRANRKAIRARCLNFLMSLRKIERKLEKNADAASAINQRKAFIEDEYDVLGEKDINREVSERLVELALEFVPSAGKVATSARKTGRKTGERETRKVKLARANREAIGELGDELDSISFSDANDNFDKWDLVMSSVKVVAVVAGALLAGTVGAAVAAFAAGAATLAGIGKTQNDIYELEGLRPELKALASDLEQLRANREKLFLEAINVLGQLQEDECDKFRGEFLAAVTSNKLNLDVASLLGSHAARKAFINGS